MEVGKVSYSPDYKSEPVVQKVKFGKIFLLPQDECEICGTSGSDVKMHRGTKMRICSECREAWKDYRGF